MKSKLIKQLHAIGVYRDPRTKQKLESMKVTGVLDVMNWVEEEMEKGVVFERKLCQYEFVKPQSKKDRVGNTKNKKGR